ncbi:sialin [Octopus bimaculoides]|nr:sialin [Octopus bimaculoides]
MSKFTNKIKRYYSCRWRLCYACSMAFLLIQTLRVDLGMAFVCMLKTPNRTTEEVNNTTSNQLCSGLENHSIAQTFEGEFEWSNTLQSHMLAGFFYGYTVAGFGGVLADKYGGKRVLGASLLSASILTILHPSLSRISGYITLVLRILTGAVSGLLPPAIQSLFGRWGPPQEISLSIGFVYAGQILGNIVGLSTGGYLCVYGFDNGWGSIFYVFGGLTLLFCCVWFYVVHDNPEVHPTISEEERSYLNKTIKCQNVVRRVPWKQLMLSPAVWAINFGMFAYAWTNVSFQTLLPLYMKETLNVNTTINGLMSSAPSVGQIIALPLSGRIADFLRSKKYLSTRAVRILFQTFSMMASASLLIVIGFLRCDKSIQITLLFFLSGISLSFSSGGVLVNNNDFAPSYAGIVFGICSFFGAIAGSLCSVAAKALTPNGTHEEWQMVFALCAAVCVSGAILFAILVKTETQVWARGEGTYIRCVNIVRIVPWKRLLLSLAVWAINVGLFSYAWTNISFMVLLPLYMKEALNVDTTSNGFMSSSPSVGQIISMPLCGRFADFLRSKKYLSTRSVRILFQTFAMVVSASLLIAMGFLRCDRTILITLLLFLSGISLSFTSGGVLVNSRDIAPSYAGIIYGIGNTFGSMAGSLSSVAAKALTPNGTREEWQVVFALCAVVCVSGAILFAILVRTDIQDWASSEGSS